MPVEQKLKNLYQLQTLLTEIDRLKALRGELPQEVEDLDAEIEGLTTRLGHFNEDVERLNADITAKQGKIAEAQAAIERYKEQINDVKNNREYDMLSKEIEFQTLEVELQNKRIGEATRTIGARRKNPARRLRILSWPLSRVCLRPLSVSAITRVTVWALFM